MNISCSICSKSFKVSPYRKNSKFCSRECKSISQKDKPTWNKGKKGIYSEETLNRMSEKKKNLYKNGFVHPLKGTHRPYSVKQKLREANLGKKQTPEHIEKAHVKLRGQKRSEDFRKHLSEIRKGAGNPSWLGGIRDEAYSIDWTETLRISIRERDHYACQICSKPQGDKVHAVHHIDYNKMNCDPDNLITLCISCHMKTNFNRDSWIKYFSKKLP